VIAAKLPALRPASLLGLATALFAALAVWPWLVPPTPSNRHAATQETTKPPPALAALPPLASLAAIVERPLFAPSRQAPPGVSVAPAGPSIDSRYRLLGIVGTGAKRHAFVAEGTRRMEIGEGDTLDGWTVKIVAQDQVVLASPAGEVTLKLSRTAAPETKPQ
jgi:type II secretory pathway component PulC